MFQSAPYPEEKRGSLYKVLSYDSGLYKGTIVELTRNDGSRCPFFRTVDGNVEDTYCIWWENLTPYVVTTCLGGE